MLVALLLAVAVVGAVACTGNDPSGSGRDATGPAPAPSAPAPTGANPGADQAPAPLRFEATGLDGSTVKGANFAGKDVALWFWAPW